MSQTAGEMYQLRIFSSLFVLKGILVSFFGIFVLKPTKILSLKLLRLNFSLHTYVNRLYYQKLLRFIHDLYSLSETARLFLLIGFYCFAHFFYLFNKPNLNTCQPTDLYLDLEKLRCFAKTWWRWRVEWTDSLNQPPCRIWKL